jgi:ParB/RepB/Spo0J family partition protein
VRPLVASGGDLCIKESKMTQAATIDPVVDLTTPEVDIDLVHVVDGYNPRKLMDKDKLARMASSMRKVGMLKPLLVVAVGDHFELVAGERRHKAAHDAELKKVPITVRPDGDRELMTATENSHHEDLDPVAQARTWQMVAEAHGLKTYKQIAEAVDDTTDGVGKHLRILKLPERVQGYFEEGIVPLDGERPLRDVARISPRIAECICEVAKREKVKPSRFVGDFGTLLLRVPETKFDDPPTMIPVWGTVGELVADPEAAAKLMSRLDDLWGQGSGRTHRLTFSEEEIDQARAAKVLLEYKRDGYAATQRFICDAGYADDLVERAVSRIEAQVTADRERRAKLAEESAAAAEGVDPAADEEEQEKQRKKALAKLKREEKKAEKGRQESLAHNEEAGRKLVRRHGGKACGQRAKVRFGVLVDLILEDYPQLGRGLRLVLPQLRELDGDEVKYVTADKATAYLREKAVGAATVEEGIEYLIEAIVADQVADISVLPRGQQFGPYVQLDEDELKALEPDIKAITPAAK